MFSWRKKKNNSPDTLLSRIFANLVFQYKKMFEHMSSPEISSHNLSGAKIYNLSII